MSQRVIGQKLQGAMRIQYLRTLKDTCNPTRAAESIDMTPHWIREIIKVDDEFAAACDNALEEGLDLLEHEVVRRGFKGVKKPVYWQGIKIDEITEYSDGLAKYYLSAHRQKFRETRDLNVKHSGGVLLIPAGKNIDEWAIENGIETEKSGETHKLIDL